MPLKVLFAMLSVSNGCFAIMMTSAHPVMAAYGGFVSVVTSAMFSILYERAFFIIADLLQRAKQHLRMATVGADNIDGRTKKYMRRRIESVPATGIQLASFGTFERAAIPIFLDFVVRNIAGALVSFQLSKD